ncbi:MAG TPA: GNAT family N-acetyltransferase [Kribbella sp.]|nr:GNAT family N-acetyltransferase [Kribbella sp.]
MAASILPPEGEHLTTGWEPDLPPGDSLVRRAVLVHASWVVEGARRAGKPWYDDPTWAGGFLGDRGAFTNLVMLKQPVDPIAVLAEVHEQLPAEVPYLFLSAWPTPDLRPSGLGLVGHPPLMARFPQTVTEPPTTDLELRRVDGAAMLAEAERVLVEGYPLPELQPFRAGALLDPALLDGPSAIWVGYDGEEPLATATAHDAAGVTLVENVAVMPAGRGRGAGAALTWAATTYRPEQAAVLIASDAGQPVYDRLDYVRIERWTVWLRT